MDKPANGRFMPDPRVIAENRSNWPLDELKKVGDQWVAWNLEHSRMVAHHADPLKVLELVKAAGMDTAEIVMEWIPPEGEETII
jgi:hypothetical protein